MSFAVRFALFSIAINITSRGMQGSHLLLNLRRLSISENTSTDDIPLDERSTVKTHGDHRTFLTTAIDAPEVYDSFSDTNEDLSEGESPVVRPGDSV